MFWKVVRGMTPRYTARGVASLKRLRAYDGIPYPYDHKRRMVVPEALKVLRIKNHRKFCKLGDLAEKRGWTKGEVISRLEARRKEKASKFWEMKKKKITARK